MPSDPSPRIAAGHETPPAPEAITWQTIRARALSRLRSGAWAPGELIPNEAALATEFGCARATVNRALRDLAEAGYLERRRKAGTRVVRNPVRKATLSIAIIRDEIEAGGHSYEYRLLSRRMAPPPRAVQDALGTNTHPCLHACALHLADGIPRVHEERWVDPGGAPGLMEVDLATTGANAWLVENVRYTEGTLSLSAAAAEAHIAAHLGCAPGSAVFVLERVTRMRETAITWVRMTYAPGYRMTTAI
ncbi:MAG: UTRA domain-containing protein [Rhodobacteraceae bacterium]|nr:UTRA domain-containing protein [Paracoccaceae bacterium]